MCCGVVLFVVDVLTAAVSIDLFVARPLFRDFCLHADVGGQSYFAVNNVPNFWNFCVYWYAQKDACVLLICKINIGKSPYAQSIVQHKLAHTT